MMVVTTTGHIVDVFGPYCADGKNNDASITKDVVEAQGLTTWLNVGDVFVTDRGFRDVADFLGGLGYRVMMPSCTRAKQLTTEEANSSRFVTITRWPVEGINASFKWWKLLQNVVPNTIVDQIGDWVRIACAFINAFRPDRLSPYVSDDVARNMIVKAADTCNSVEARVDQGSLSSRGRNWLSITNPDALPDFPVMTEQEVRTLTFGVYQVKQARSYTSEHLNKDGHYEFLYHK